MSDTAVPAAAMAPQKLESQQAGDADREAFARVEKWLAVIRELAREPSKAASRS
jgi:hypothetical protein